MSGRGIDQILPHPGDSVIHEPYMRSALGYVELAETAHGSIPRPCDFSYIWGEALDVFDRMKPDVKIINLETSITKSNDYWKGKGIHYRMNPENVPCLTAAGIDCCSLANNHVLDWGYAGLLETMETLRAAGIRSSGAGLSMREAREPAVLDAAGKGRAMVFSFGFETSGIPFVWGATPARPGVNLLPDMSEDTVRALGDQVRSARRSNDIVVASVHWGGNWGYAVPRAHRKFAHDLIDKARVDIIHGHSSHHALGIEVYNHRLILYGCGDFLNDYEGISGHEEYRSDIGLMYFPSVDPSSGRLVQLRMVPARICRFRVVRASREDAFWLQGVLNRVSEPLGSHVYPGADDVFTLR